MHSRILAAIAVSAVLMPVAIAASIAPPEFRECMRSAVDAYQGGLLDSLRQFNDANEEALDERRVRYVESYDSETDTEIRQRQRDAEREYGRRHSDIKRDKRDRDRDILRTHSDAKRACRDLRRDIERQSRIGDQPTFPTCPPGRICGTSN